MAQDYLKKMLTTFQNQVAKEVLAKERLGTRLHNEVMKFPTGGLPFLPTPPTTAPRPMPLSGGDANHPLTTLPKPVADALVEIGTPTRPPLPTRPAAPAGAQPVGVPLEARVETSAVNKLGPVNTGAFDVVREVAPGRLVNPAPRDYDARYARAKRSTFDALDENERGMINTQRAIDPAPYKAPARSSQYYDGLARWLQGK